MNKKKTNWPASALAILALAVCGNAHADPVNFTCTTDPLTTSVVIFTRGTDVTLRVIHSHGAAYMPLSNQVITPSDLPGLEQKAKDLEQLGNTYDIHFPASQCSTKNQGLIDCHGAIDQTINGHKLDWIYVYESKATTVMPLLDAPEVQTWMNISFVMDGKDYDFGMNYDPSGCIVTAGTSGAARAKK